MAKLFNIELKETISGVFEIEAETREEAIQKAYEGYYKGENIYILRSELNLKDNEYLLGDLIGLEVYDLDKLIGVVIDYSDENKDVLLKVKGDKIFYIPLIDYYIKSINIKERKIITNKGSDLII